MLVCESQFDLMKLRIFLVYTESSTMRIGEAGFEQLANVVSFRVADTFFPRKKCIFLPRGDVVKTLLMTKIEISMLYFTPNSLHTLQRINVLKKQNINFLPVAILTLARRVSLHLISQKSGIRLHHVCRGWSTRSLEFRNIFKVRKNEFQV